jgi:hypothetical protein
MLNEGEVEGLELFSELNQEGRQLARKIAVVLSGEVEKESFSIFPDPQEISPHSL